MATIIQNFFKDLYNQEVQFQQPNIYYCFEPNSVKLTTDPHYGLHVELGRYTEIPDNLSSEIEKLCAISTTLFHSVWVDMETEQPQLPLNGFTRFKDYNKWRAFKWLSSLPCTIAASIPNFTVTALILDKTYKKILLVQDTFRWRAPQGFFDLEEDDPTSTLTTLHRVVKQEAGINSLGLPAHLLLGLPRQNIWHLDYDQGSLNFGEYQTGVWIDINHIVAGAFGGHPIDPGLKNFIPQDENGSQNIHKKIKLGDD